MQDSFRRVGAVALLFAVICLGSHQAKAIQCAIFARSVTGLELSGDAWQWWNHASGTYGRGNAPKAGAVLVFMRSAPMRHGHVSVVRRIVNNREILVDHANWGTRGAVSRNVAVMDDSPNNDWSSVRVAFGGGYGRSNPTYGFIYEAPSSSADLIEVANHASDPADQATDDVFDAPRHRNHRWIKLAVLRIGGSPHGRGLSIRQDHATHGGRRSATQVSYEPVAHAHAKESTIHVVSGHRTTVKEAVGSRTAAAIKTAANVDTGSTRHHAATKGPSAKAVASTGKRKTSARG